MKTSKVFKKETYVTDGSAKMYAYHQLEHKTIQATVIFTDEHWYIMEFHTGWDFEEFVKENDFELINNGLWNRQ